MKVVLPHAKIVLNFVRAEQVMKQGSVCGTALKLPTGQNENPMVRFASKTQKGTALINEKC